MNKTLFFVLIFIILVVAGCGIFFLVRGIIDNQKEGDLGHILKNQLNGREIKKSDIKYIKSGDPFDQNEDYSVAEFIDSFWDKNYKPRDNGRIGSTAHSYYVAYDKNDQILFTLVDVGNRGLCYIKAGSFNISDDNHEFLFRMQE